MTLRSVELILLIGLLTYSVTSEVQVVGVRPILVDLFATGCGASYSGRIALEAACRRIYEWDCDRVSYRVVVRANATFAERTQLNIDMGCFGRRVFTAEVFDDSERILTPALNCLRFREASGVPDCSPDTNTEIAFSDTANFDELTVSSGCGTLGTEGAIMVKSGYRRVFLDGTEYEVDESGTYLIGSYNGNVTLVSGTAPGVRDATYFVSETECYTNLAPASQDCFLDKFSGRVGLSFECSASQDTSCGTCSYRYEDFTSGSINADFVTVVDGGYVDVIGNLSCAFGRPLVRCLSLSAHSGPALFNMTTDCGSFNDFWGFFSAGEADLTVPTGCTPETVKHNGIEYTVKILAGGFTVDDFSQNNYELQAAQGEGDDPSPSDSSLTSEGEGASVAVPILASVVSILVCCILLCILCVVIILMSVMVIVAAMLSLALVLTTATGAAMGGAVIIEEAIIREKKYDMMEEGFEEAALQRYSVLASEPEVRPRPVIADIGADQILRHFESWMVINMMDRPGLAECATFRMALSCLSTMAYGEKIRYSEEYTAVISNWPNAELTEGWVIGVCESRFEEVSRKLSGKCTVVPGGPEDITDLDVDDISCLAFFISTPKEDTEDGESFISDEEDSNL